MELSNMETRLGTQRSVQLAVDQLVGHRHPQKLQHIIFQWFRDVDMLYFQFTLYLRSSIFCQRLFIWG